MNDVLMDAWAKDHNRSNNATASDALYSAPMSTTISLVRSWMILWRHRSVSLESAAPGIRGSAHLSLRINVSSSASFIRALRFFYMQGLGVMNTGLNVYPLLLTNSRLENIHRPF